MKPTLPPFGRPTLPPTVPPPPNPASPPPAGFLSFASEASTAARDLTILGPVDWRQLDLIGGLGTNTMIASPGYILSDVYGGVDEGQYNDSPRAVTWSNGTPNLNGNTINGVWASSVDATGGRRIRCRADRQRRILTLPVSAYNGAMWAAISLGDGSAAPIESALGIVAGAGAAVTGTLDIAFQSASDNQLLTVLLYCAAAGAFSNVGIQGAALRNA